MISIRTNLGDVSLRLIDKLTALKAKDITRPVATDVLDMMQERIHEEGKAADGSQIGTYSNSYMKIRTGNYRNSDRAKKGKSKGSLKNAGVYTKGKNKGKERPKYNRTDDTKIIVSLTRRLENDWGVIPTDKGWGIGFLNKQKGTKKEPVSSDKMKYVEAKKKKKIAGLTAQEKQFAIERFKEEVDEILK